MTVIHGDSEDFFLSVITTYMPSHRSPGSALHQYPSSSSFLLVGFESQTSELTVQHANHSTTAHITRCVKPIRRLSFAGRPLDLLGSARKPYNLSIVGDR